ncbi:MAG TPA: Hsp70 family protein [Actinophytocola sp.]|nr:Hsp70 family protein [Actinophytocola sp.]
MPYAVGIDLGSGRTTAAISRNDRERWSDPEIVPLDGEPQAASVLHLTDEGTVEVGSRALRQVPTRADRITRGFVDRLGDEIPITLGGQPYPAEVLLAALVGWVLDQVEAAEGVPASQLVIAHPAGWGAHRRAVLSGALREITLPELTLLPRPVAAAESYAAVERVKVGEEIAVHSLGTGRFESAVLRRGGFGFELRAHADSAEAMGGELFDDLLAEHVLAELGTGVDGVVDGVALAKLRAACATAKERLSTELAVTVPAPARSTRGTVMVNRTDLEELIRPAVETTVATLRRTIQAAGTTAGSLRAVVLVGGCGRIPLVSELVTAGVRVHASALADPETAVARGAALAAARVAKPTVQAAAPAVRSEPIGVSAGTHTDLMRFDDLPPEDLADVGPPPPRPPVEITPLDPPKRRLLRLGTRTRPDDLDDEFDVALTRHRAADESDVDIRPAEPRRSRRDPDLHLSDDESDVDSRLARRHPGRRDMFDDVEPQDLRRRGAEPPGQDLRRRRPSRRLFDESDVDQRSAHGRRPRHETGESAVDVGAHHRADESLSRHGVRDEPRDYLDSGLPRRRRDSR